MKKNIENFLIREGFNERSTPNGKDTEWFKKESFYEIVVYCGVVLFHITEEHWLDALRLESLTDKCFSLKDKIDNIEING